jgi:PAS domain S-box-containing protein
MSKENKTQNKSKPAKTKASQSRPRTDKNDLRKKAENKLKKKETLLDRMSDFDIRKLAHELQVHQIELEMQNEELRATQEQLEESRTKYADLYDFAPVGYFTLDKNGIVLDANLTGAFQLSIDRSHIIKKPFAQFVHKEDQDVFYLHRKSVYKIKSRLTCEIRLKRKDKSVFYAQLVSNNIKDSEDNYKQMTIAVMNISERTLADEKVRQSEENYRMLLGAICDGIAVLDRQWKYVRVNEAFTAIVGKEMDELLGIRIMDVFPGVEDSIFFKTFRKVMRSGKPEVVNDSYTFEDGREGFFEAHVYPVPEGIFIIVSDITDRKKMEEELKIKQLLNELLIDSIPHSAMLISKDRKIIAANKMAREVGAIVGGYCWQEFGKCQFISDDDKIYIDQHGKPPEAGARCSFCNADEALDSRESICIEVTAWDRIWDTYWKPLDKDTYLHYAIDITERKQAEEEISKHRERLKKQVDERTKELGVAYKQLQKEVTEKLNYQAEAMRSAQLAAIGELAAGVAHEINNPINGIINGAQIILSKMDPDSKEHQMARMVMKEGDRIADIVSSLLSFARENKEIKRQVHLLEIMTDTLALSESQIRKERIKLKNVPSTLPDIYAQPQQIKQVFLNLINNARYALNKKYPSVHEDKVLSISGESITVDDEPLVRVTFYDTGVGIPYEDLVKIVNPFFTTKPPNKGTGLGLSISHGIISDHGGTLKFDSILDEFTKVTIDLPVNDTA